MKTKALELVRIRIQWAEFIGSQFYADGETIEFARVTPKCYLVRYGQGRILKRLKRFNRWGEPTRGEWREYFGWDTRRRIIFTLL